MVGEFPELQGVMGGYYARLQGEDARVADAVAQHYRPLGPTDEVPTEPVAMAVALADKLDQLAGFFAVDERPTGSGDPFALRRAALGIIRILRENGLRVALRSVFAHHLGEAVLPSIGGAALAELDAAREEYKARTGSYPLNPVVTFTAITLEQLTALREFIAERLRVQLRAEGAGHDIVAASLFGDDDILRILARADALKALVESEDGTNLLAAYKRAQNILRIEEKKDGPPPSPSPNLG
jgi:glycyl-tRNA synthetase beta chain